MSTSAEQVIEQLQKAEDVVVELSAPTAALICSITDQARGRGEDRSFEYWLEECAIAGYNSFKRTWKYGDEARDSRDFKKALEASKIKFIAGVPATPQDQVGYAELCVKYHQFNVSTEDVKNLRAANAQLIREQEAVNVGK